jgi:hypothetical protein
MRKLLITAVLLIIGINSIYAQGELTEEQKVFYRNEKTAGLLLNTDGFGISYREGKRLDYLNKRLFEIDFGIIKHPKEVRLSNPYYQTTKSFVFGKLNSLFFIRGGIGHQHEIFSKADQGGVAIRYFYSAGPAIAIYKPIYYKIIYPVSASNIETIDEKFELSIHQPGDIYSKSAFSKGLDETKFLPGLYAKGGFNFEYSKEDIVIHAIELGISVNAFPKKIPIMATEDNKAVFLSVFVSYRIGLIIDPLDPESNKLKTIFIRKRN